MRDADLIRAAIGIGAIAATPRCPVCFRSHVFGRGLLHIPEYGASLLRFRLWQESLGQGMEAVLSFWLSASVRGALLASSMIRSQLFRIHVDTAARDFRFHSRLSKSRKFQFSG